MIDATTQTESTQTTSIEIQTDFEPLQRTKSSIQQELIQGLGFSQWSELESFIESQKRVSSTKISQTPPSQIRLPPTLRQRISANKWSNRLVARIPSTAPAYLYNSFPESTRPFISNIALYTAAIYLGGVLSGLFASTSLIGSTNHYHFGSNFDAGQWNQCELSYSLLLLILINLSR